MKTDGTDKMSADSTREFGYRVYNGPCKIVICAKVEQRGPEERRGEGGTISKSNQKRTMMRRIGQKTDQARGAKGRPQLELAATATSLCCARIMRLEAGLLRIALSSLLGSHTSHG